MNQRWSMTIGGSLRVVVGGDAPPTRQIPSRALPIAACLKVATGFVENVG
jgi:hypothetical protein